MSKWNRPMTRYASGATPEPRVRPSEVVGSKAWAVAETTRRNRDGGQWKSVRTHDRRVWEVVPR